MTYEIIQATNGEEPLTQDERNRLWLEIVMKRPAFETLVPNTQEARRLRIRLQEQWDWMKSQGIGAELLKD